MQVSIDVSLYPLNERIIPPIDDFKSILKNYDNLGVQTNCMGLNSWGFWWFDDCFENWKRKLLKKKLIQLLNLKIVKGEISKYD